MTSSIKAAPQNGEGRKIHPHKFALWVAMGSIAMMFAGLTSAYVVRQAQGNWRVFNLPTAFNVSTAVILASSVTMWLGTRLFKQRRMLQYRWLILTTLMLGLVFGVLQYYGFWQLYHIPQQYFIASADAGIKASGPEVVRVNGNPSESFIFIIAGLHLLHILGGIVALALVFIRSYRTRVRTYNATGLEIVGAYWHFVDLLWIYLFLFFLGSK